jgi:hypothetical protein
MSPFGNGTTSLLQGRRGAAGHHKRRPSPTGGVVPAPQRSPQALGFPLLGRGDDHNKCIAASDSRLTVLGAIAVGLR